MGKGPRTFPLIFTSWGGYGSRTQLVVGSFLTTAKTSVKTPSETHVLYVLAQFYLQSKPKFPQLNQKAGLLDLIIRHTEQIYWLRFYGHFCASFTPWAATVWEFYKALYDVLICVSLWLVLWVAFFMHQLLYISRVNQEDKFWWWSWKQVCLWATFFLMGVRRSLSDHSCWQYNILFQSCL